MLIQVLKYASVASGTMAAGATIGGLWFPPAKVRSYLQHLAAGVVFAAAAVEVLPDIMHRRAPLAASIGFAAGVALMLAIRALTANVGGDDDKDIGGIWRVFSVVGIDILVDGILIGIITSAGQRAGLLLTVALAIELFSLGLATTFTIRRRGTSSGRSVLTVCTLALVPLVGATIGSQFLGSLQAGWMEAVLAFSLAALLYLVTEELLVEAHEVPETPLATAMFFAGFLMLLMIDMLA